MNTIKKRQPDSWALHDDRSIFANSVCKIIYEKNNGDLIKCVSELKPIYDSFFEHVRNVYELVGSEIPMFYLYELKTRPEDNWDFSELESNIDNEIQKAIESCHEYFN